MLFIFVSVYILFYCNLMHLNIFLPALIPHQCIEIKYFCNQFLVWPFM